MIDHTLTLESNECDDFDTFFHSFSSFVNLEKGKDP
jgi:hypothetical protein